MPKAASTEKRNKMESMIMAALAVTVLFTLWVGREALFNAKSLYMEESRVRARNKDLR